jgi:hypothetical protein
MRTSQLRAKRLEQARQGQNLYLQVLIHRVKLGFEFITDLNEPSPVYQYGIQSI